MIYKSKMWDEDHNLCTVHGDQVMPCQLCLSEKEKNVQVVLEQDELDFLEEVSLTSRDYWHMPPTIRDVLPTMWADRVVSA